MAEYILVFFVLEHKENKVCMLFHICFAALSNGRGEYLLNGDFVVSMFKREVKVGNAVIEYSGSDHVVERINCTERIEEEIIIQVIWHQWIQFELFLLSYIVSPHILTMCEVFKIFVTPYFWPICDLFQLGAIRR